MEIEDGAYPLVQRVIVTADLKTAFDSADVALLVGGFPRLPGMERKDLLEKNAQIFVAQGKALNDYAKRTCKICVVANPTNTNCMIAQRNCPNIPAENFTSMLMLDHNRMLGQLKKKLDVHSTSQFSKIHVWGNHSTTMVPDITNGLLDGAKSVAASVDKEWLVKEFNPLIQTRGAAVLKARQKSSAMSAANACVDHMRLWMNGTPPGSWTSFGVLSDGSYGVAKGIVFSFPVECKNGKWSIVQGLKIEDDIQKMLKSSEEELLGEQAVFEAMSK
jgi:malate dehydrogenase